MSSLFFSRINDRERLATFFTVVAGSLYVLTALYILFYPWQVTCRPGDSSATICTGQSYIDMGGSLIGYAFLSLFIGLGLGVIASTLAKRMPLICVFRWLTVLISVIFGFVGALSIGLIFAPAGLLMLLPALSCLRGHKTAADSVREAAN